MNHSLSCLNNILRLTDLIPPRELYAPYHGVRIFEQHGERNLQMNADAYDRLQLSPKSRRFSHPKPFTLHHNPPKLTYGDLTVAILYIAGG